MNNRPTITALKDVRPDTLADMTAAADEHLDQVEPVARIMAGEHAALVEAGTSPLAAAIIVGNRWRMTS